jgi:hypothetical protein
LNDEERWRGTDPSNGPSQRADEASHRAARADASPHRAARADEAGDPREPPAQGPSAPRTLRFNPLSTGLGVALGVGIPIVVFGYTRPSGVNNTIIVIGIGIGLIVGLVAGLWVAHRGGDVWRGPQL